MHLSLRPQGAEPGQGAPVVVQTDIITRRSDHFLAMLRSTQSEDEMQRLQCLAMPQTKEQAMSILVARSLLGCTLSRELYKVCRKLGMREMLLRLSEILSTLSPRTGTCSTVLCAFTHGRLRSLIIFKLSAFLPHDGETRQLCEGIDSEIVKLRRRLTSVVVSFFSPTKSTGTALLAIPDAAHLMASALTFSRLWIPFFKAFFEQSKTGREDLRLNRPTTMPTGGREALRLNRPRFEIGTRVSCRMPRRWQRGLVVAHHYEEPEGIFNPYQIELGDGTLIYAPWDDDECIRKVNAELRFDIGTKVQCWYEEKWQKGRVVQHDYEEPHGVLHPYQIELHDDVLIYAPRDDDEYILRDFHFEVSARVRTLALGRLAYRPARLP